MKVLATTLGAVLVLGTATASLADGHRVLRWASAGDALTLDPHGQNEGPTATMAHQIYEPLVSRDNDLQLVAALAISWEPTDDPNVWEFTLRQGVQFHDGSAFNAEDVVFSLNRARHEISDYKGLLTSIADVTAVGAYTVHVTTDGPNPLLPNNLTNLFMMDKEWSVANGVELPQDYASGEETFAARNANGTGAYILETREPGIRTELVRNPDYWGNDEFATEIERIVYTPVTSAPTRVAALLSGELDFVLDPPVQDLRRLAQADGVKVTTTPENRVIFLGMDVRPDDHDWDNIVDHNPLSDLRVRQAMNLAISRDAIQSVVMRGQSAPAGMVAPPFVNGYSEEMDVRQAQDIAAAKALLDEAGYGGGFEITLHCPNDRYINDEGICQAVVGMMGQVGIVVSLDARPKSIHFAELSNRNTAFYMLGWGVPTFDSEYIFSYLFHTDDGTRGSWNGTHYSNPTVDQLTTDIVTEVDLAARNEKIQEIWDIVNADMIYLPVHHQVLNWAMAEDINVHIRGDNSVRFKYVTYNN